MGQPTVARRALGAAMTKLRTATGMTRAQAAAAIGYSAQTIQRIEEGTQATRKHQVDALCDEYDAPAGLRSQLHGYALDGARRGWWQEHKEGVPAEFQPFVETEHDADVIQVLETEYIPGLLQTPEYLLALQEAQPQLPPQRAAAIRGLRSSRKELILGRANPPKMRFLVGKGAFGYLEDLPEVLTGQVKHILEVAELASVEIRVITGLHAAMAGSFNILTPNGGADPFVYTDSVDGCRYVEDRDVVSLYQRTFLHVWKSAIPVEEYLR